jgi:hypothetical protein
VAEKGGDRGRSIIMKEVDMMLIFVIRKSSTGSFAFSYQKLTKP